MREAITTAIAGGALVLACSAAAEEAPAAQAEINAVIEEAFTKQLEPVVARICADHDVDCLSEELIARYRIDQWARE